MKSPFLYLIIGLAFTVTAENEKPVLKFGYTEACPHMCPNEENQGFTTDIARSIFVEQFGYTVEFYALPWARAVADVAKGELHGVLSAGKDETPELWFPEREIAVQSDCFIGLASDNWVAGDIYSFLNRRTIVFKGWANESAYRAALGSSQYEELFDDFSIDSRYMERVVNMVKLGRADAFWMDVNVYAYYQQRYPQLFDAQLKNLGCIKFQYLYLAFSPAFEQLSAQLMAEFDEGMQQLRKTGDLVSILQRYGVQDWH
ncbi:substrate-binding periplasmic protein [Bowmanella denitrificans]|uniref:substrate-binding periplasmic protein n=1 Tax=Bowmanella denitrificans TaxID=366582 RepID=UPI0015584C34|nr:transporter substrate-binding domain-containing protein [Bowmanella denitrificans]